MKHLFLVMLTMIAAGCAICPSDDLIREARQQIIAGKAECIVIRGCRIAAVEKGRGVSPLLNIYKSRPETMLNAAVVDKVIGRAAAFIIISGKASRAHGELISEDAIILLRKHGITATGTKIVPRILNRNMDDLCPLEKSVTGIDDPAAAMDALQKRIAELSRKK